jgi:hypothetical protein
VTERPSTSALGRCVGDAGTFLAQAFGRAPHRWRSSGFTDLLSVAAIDEHLAAGGLRRPAVRLARDGEVLPAASFTRRARTGSVWIDDLVDPGRALAAFADGATIVLNSLHRWWPALGRFCAELEGELGHPVQANAYLTPAGASGYAPHHDTHDVLVLQVEGTKRWTLRPPLVDAPLERHRSDHALAATQPALADELLEPGDCLYLPRGWIHSASAQTEASLHLTIGILAATRHDLLRRIVDRTAEDPRFRRSLPAGYADDRDAAAQVVKDAVADLLGWLEALPVDEVAEDLVWRETARRRPRLEGQLLELARRAPVTDATSVAVRPGVAWRFGPGGPGRIGLELADRRLDLPASLQPALRRLLAGPTVVVADLADLLDEASRSVLVGRLVREGVLRRVDGP